MLLFAPLAVAASFLLPAAFAQSAGPAPTLIYTYMGQSIEPSILSAIETAGAPALSILSETAGPDTATGLVPAFPTTATIGPVVIPTRSSNFTYTSAVGLETATARAPYLASGTLPTTLASGILGSPTAKSGVQGFSSPRREVLGALLGLTMTAAGIMAGARVLI